MEIPSNQISESYKEISQGNLLKRISEPKPAIRIEEIYGHRVSEKKGDPCPVDPNKNSAKKPVIDYGIENKDIIKLNSIPKDANGLSNQNQIQTNPLDESNDAKKRSINNNSIPKSSIGKGETIQEKTNLSLTKGIKKEENQVPISGEIQNMSNPTDQNNNRGENLNVENMTKHEDFEKQFLNMNDSQNDIQNLNQDIRNFFPTKKIVSSTKKEKKPQNEDNKEEIQQIKPTSVSKEILQGKFSDKKPLVISQKEEEKISNNPSSRKDIISENVTFSKQGNIIFQEHDKLLSINKNEEIALKQQENTCEISEEKNKLLDNEIQNRNQGNLDLYHKAHVDDNQSREPKYSLSKKINHPLEGGQIDNHLQIPIENEQASKSFIIVRQPSYNEPMNDDTHKTEEQKLDQNSYKLASNKIQSNESRNENDFKENKSGEKFLSNICNAEPNIQPVEDVKKNSKRKSSHKKSLSREVKPEIKLPEEVQIINSNEQQPEIPKEKQSEHKSTKALKSLEKDIQVDKDETIVNARSKGKRVLSKKKQKENIDSEEETRNLEKQKEIDLHNAEQQIEIPHLKDNKSKKNKKRNNSKASKKVKSNEHEKSIEEESKVEEKVDQKVHQEILINDKKVRGNKKEIINQKKNKSRSKSKNAKSKHEDEEVKNESAKKIEDKREIIKSKNRKKSKKRIMEEAEPSPNKKKEPILEKKKSEKNVKKEKIKEEKHFVEEPKSKNLRKKR